MTTPASGTAPGLPVAKLLAPPTPVAGTVAKTPGEQMGKDTFLKLLVAQLKYQNPLEPADSAEFMAQTAQFTVVEKLDALTKTNAELLSTNRALSASSLIGQAVVRPGAQGDAHDRRPDRYRGAEPAPRLPSHADAALDLRM